MDTSFIIPFIDLMQTLPVEFLALLTFLVCAVSVLVFFRLFGASGLYLFNAIIVLVANIQVLKTAPFWIAPEPIALGTVAFATSFLVTDMLTEHYGKDVARKGVWMSFSGYLLMTVLMVMTLGFNGPEDDRVQGAMMTIFTPSPRILIASLLSFAISQFLDISLFDWIGKKTQGRFLWLRTNGSTLLSGLFDNVCFSLLAWIILSPQPVSLYTLFFTYILGSYISRVIVSLASTPIIYLSYRFMPVSRTVSLTDSEQPSNKAA